MYGLGNGLCLDSKSVEINVFTVVGLFTLGTSDTDRGLHLHFSPASGAPGPILIECNAPVHYLRQGQGCMDLGGLSGTLGHSLNFWCCS